MPRVAFAMLYALLLGWPGGPARAQEARQHTPQISTRELAARFATGRYMAPVHCTREDGSLIDLQEALTVRADPSSLGTTTGDYRLRVTFFGIDVSGVSHCHNLMTNRLPDRRGILHLSFRGQTREDLGLSFFRNELRDGEIEYHVEDGRLLTREIGTEAEPVTIEFDDDAQFIMRELTPRSDPARMLERFAAKLGITGQMQPFEIEVASEAGHSFKIWVIKDALANETGHRTPGSRD